MAELSPFWSWQGPQGSHVRFRALLGRNLPFDLAPQAHFRKFRGFLALAIVLGTILESGASLRLAAPNPVASSFGLVGPPHSGDVPVQAPGPGRFQRQHRALAGAQGALQLVQCQDGSHGTHRSSRINT